MATKYCADAIEWWLRNQGKFEGASVTTKETAEGSREFEITGWVVDSVPKPSDEMISQIITDYETYLEDEKVNSIKKQRALADRLNLSEDDLKTLAELLKK